MFVLSNWKTRISNFQLCRKRAFLRENIGTIVFFNVFFLRLGSRWCKQHFWHDQIIRETRSNHPEPVSAEVPNDYKRLAPTPGRRRGKPSLAITFECSAGCWKIVEKAFKKKPISWNLVLGDASCEVGSFSASPFASRRHHLDPFGSSRTKGYKTYGNNTYVVDRWAYFSWLLHASIGLVSFFSHAVMFPEEFRRLLRLCPDIILSVVQYFQGGDVPKSFSQSDTCESTPDFCRNISKRENHQAKLHGVNFVLRYVQYSLAR